MSETLTERDRTLVVRASAHVRPADELEPLQRFALGVSEEAVARLLLWLERGTVLHRTRLGRWYAPVGHPLGRHVSQVVMEAVRTGLVRHWVDREGDHLVPAKVHVAGEDGRSLCHFAGENLGPMRARLVTVSDLAIADCLDCTERAV